MKDKKVNNPLILIAPMDWGLGHATRCIPIITGLLGANCRVIIAASGSGLALLQKEFPSLICINIRGYNIHYSRNKSWLAFTLIKQVPGILYTILREHFWLKNAISKYAIDAVISDNRMGLFNKKITCIYITHQLQIITGSRITDWLSRKIHYWFIDKYNECWVPDNEQENSLAGELSHPVSLPKAQLTYIGPLSRFTNFTTEKKFGLAVILSGPEPQRTIFEKMVLKDIDRLNRKTVLVRGLPIQSSGKEVFPSSVNVFDHLDGEELNKVVLQSELIISRCGYSTIMDLVALQKKAILVPTPGQTEQEYLSGYLSQKKLFYCIEQDEFSLIEALDRAGGFSFSSFNPGSAYYKQVLARLVRSLLSSDQQ